MEADRLRVPARTVLLALVVSATEVAVAAGVAITRADPGDLVPRLIGVAAVVVIIGVGVVALVTLRRRPAAHVPEPVVEAPVRRPAAVPVAAPVARPVAGPAPGRDEYVDSLLADLAS